MILKNQCFRSDDLLADLGRIVDRDVKHYKSDYNYDKEIFVRAAKEREKRNFIWITRDSGTSCMYERNAYINETFGHAECTTFLPDKTARAYIIDIEKNKGQKVIGKVFPLDKEKLLSDIKQHSVSAENVEIDPKGGKILVVPYADYNANPYAYLQGAEYFNKEYLPNEDDAYALHTHLQELKRQRQKVFGIDKRIDRIQDAKREERDNSPEKDRVIQR